MARWFACIVAWLALGSLLATEAPIDLPEGYELAEIDPADWRTPPLLTCAALPAAPPSTVGHSALDAFPSTLIAGCVNAISGHFLDSEIDLMVPGPVPLVGQRHYCSGTGRWRFRHMPHLRVAPSQGEHHLEAYYRDDDGSGMGYRAPLKEHLFCIPGRLFRRGFTIAAVERSAVKPIGKTHGFPLSDRERPSATCSAILPTSTDCSSDTTSESSTSTVHRPASFAS